MYLKSMLIFRRCLKSTPLYRREHDKYIHVSHPTLDPDELLANSTLLKDSRTVTAGTAGNFFIKRYNTKNFWKKLKRSFQYPRSYRCLAGSILLRETGILTPEVFYADRQYLVTEKLENFSPDLFLSSHPEKCLDFAPALRKLHDSGFFYGDLRVRNIYGTENGSFGLIDLDSILFCSSPEGLPQRKRIKETARVISSAILLPRKEETEKFMEEFLRNYSLNKDDILDRKVLMEEILLYIKKTNMDWCKYRTENTAEKI